MTHDWPNIRNTMNMVLRTLALLVFGFASLASSSAQKGSGWGHNIDQGGWPDGWHLEKDDLLGLSRDQVLRLGEAGFERYATSKNYSGDDYAAMVFADCLESRNNDLLRKAPRRKARLIKSIRSTLCHLILTAIAIEDTESGGGTAGVHEPRYGRWRSEEVIYELLTRPPRRPQGVSSALETIKRNLLKFAHAAPWASADNYGQSTYLRDQTKELHEFAKGGIRYLHTLRVELNALDSQRKAAVVECAFFYCNTYQNGMTSGSSPGYPLPSVEESIKNLEKPRTRQGGQ